MYKWVVKQSEILPVNIHISFWV